MWIIKIFYFLLFNISNRCFEFDIFGQLGVHVGLRKMRLSLFLWNLCSSLALICFTISVLLVSIIIFFSMSILPLVFIMGRFDPVFFAQRQLEAPVGLHKVRLSLRAKRV